MRFSSSATPTLTPLGVRLMSLSRHKLDHLEPRVGGRDRAASLRIGVLVREAVRSAWATVDEGPSELTDWRAPTALGLDTLAEEEEEEESYDQEAAEAAWLDDVLSSFDENEIANRDVTVSKPEADDFDYDDDTIQAFSLSDMSSSYMDIEEADALTAMSLDVDVTVVEVAAVDSDSDYDYDDDEVATSWMELDVDHKFKAMHIAGITDVDPVHSAEHIEHMECEDCGILPPPDAPPSYSSLPALPSTALRLDVGKLPPRPAYSVAPSYNSYSVFIPVDTEEFEDDPPDDCACPDLIDPGEHRAHSDIDDDEDDDECPCTPPLLSCEDLEVAATKGVTWSDADWNLDALTTI